MNRQHVVSSNLLSVGYDESSGTLEIEFRTGGIYQYFGVPNSIYIGLISADSKGRYFHSMIKNGGYAFRKIN